MLITALPQQLREEISDWKRQGLTIGFVPTMGNLHLGHLTLVEEAKSRADIVVVSIFVNPMQFDRDADLNAYPRTLQQDCDLLKEKGVDLVFTPAPEVMYPKGLKAQTFVEVPGISSLLEGALRPGHFRGVSTVVTKFFNLVTPDLACFGEKDCQQLTLIKHMVTDLAMPIEIIPVATVREASGLAMSSRNGYLTKEEKRLAPKLAQVMNWICQQIKQGERNMAHLQSAATRQLDQAGFNTDSIDIVDAESLRPLAASSQQAVVLMAAFLGKARLIDNQTVCLQP